MIRRPVVNSSVLSKPKPAVDVILDSGAYSAWRLGKPVDIDKYCDYLLANLDWMGHYVCLDVINPKDPEAAAAASFDNLLYMRKRGLKPVPVFHVGEDISWLFRMLDLGCEYIGLSASSLVSRNQVDEWYGMAWSHLTTTGGRPIVKAHAFGEGRLASQLQFPWYSADSTSWIYDAQRNGAMTMPGGQKIVHRNDGLHSRQAKDIERMSEHEKVSFDRIIQEAGIDPAGFAERGSFTSTVLRTYMAMLDCAKTQSLVQAAQPISYRPDGFFLKDAWPAEKAIAGTPFKYHLVIGNNTIAFSVLAFAGYTNVLSSYFYITAHTHHSNLERFSRTPREICQTVPEFAKSYQILERYVAAPLAA